MTDDRLPPEAELTRLADGSLPDDRQAELRARAEQSPELAAALAEQERAVTMLRAVEEVRAPAALRAAVAELTDAGDAARGRRARGRQARGGRAPGRGRPGPLRPAALLPGAAALAAVIAVLAIVLVTGATGTPTVAQAARLALSQATLPAPGVDHAQPASLAIRGAGIPFPNWAHWTSTGARRDRLGGRTVTTVYYVDARGTRVGYAITSGRALGGARGATVRAYGVRFTLQRQGAARLISWERNGHTCVLAGPTAGYDLLLALAAGGDGATGTTGTTGA